jgi:hypothetical protein
MACESGNFTIADLDRKADYGPLNGLSTDLVKLNSIGERRGKPRQHLTIGEASDVSIGDLHLDVAESVL